MARRKERKQRKETENEGEKWIETEEKTIVCRELKVKWFICPCVCSGCGGLHVWACQHSIISEKNWIVPESGWLMQSTAASLPGHCLQMSHLSDKIPLYSAASAWGSHMDEIRALDLRGSRYICIIPMNFANNCNTTTGERTGSIFAFKKERSNNKLLIC